MTTQIRHGALATMALFAFGCSDASTPPHQTSPAGSALARHMDSLVVAAKSNPRDSLWASTVESAEYIPAYGGTPASITITSAAGTQTWQAFILEEAQPGQDSTYFLWAYSDSDFTNVLIAGAVHAPNQVAGFVSYLITNDTTVVPGYSTMEATTVSSGSSCLFTSGLVNIPDPFAAGSCNLGTFAATVAASYQGNNVRIQAQTITGVILK